MADPVKCNVHKALSKHTTYKAKDQIRRVDLDLNPVGKSGKIAYLLKNVFDPEECQKLIELTEAAGYSPALVHSGHIAVLAPGYRDSQRVMVDDKEFVKILFQRIGHLLPQTYKRYGGMDYKLLEINERLRFLRYDPGDEFKPHCDGTYERDDGSAVTMITLQIYLNDSHEGVSLEGGETTFLSYPQKPTNRVAVVPEPGMVLVFQHNLLHEGSLVKSGRKYTIRTDVLYTHPEDEDE